MATLIGSSLGLFVSRVLPARTAELLGLHAFGVFLFVLGGGVVPVLALTTLQRNDFAHLWDSFLRSAGRMEPAPDS
jgi:hypothetical protein